MLIGIDLRKDPQVLERAYDDAAGVTAEFNINALRHLNRELGANFDLDAFDHLAVWVEDDSRIEMHLVSKRDQVVQLGGEKIRFERGEHLRTEYCHKYTLDSFSELAATAGLAVKRVWTDANQHVQRATARTGALAVNDRRLGAVPRCRRHAAGVCRDAARSARAREPQTIARRSSLAPRWGAGARQRAQSRQPRSIVLSATTDRVRRAWLRTPRG